MNRAKEIRKRHARGESCPELAAEYGLSRSNVWRIVTWKTWR